MSKDKLTEIEQEVLDYIIRHKAEYNGNSPSYDEIIFNSKLKTKAIVSRMLKKMQEKGAISFELGIARSIEVPGYEWRKVAEPETTTMTDRNADTTCAVCGFPFTDVEWKERYRKGDEVFHSECLE